MKIIFVSNYFNHHQRPLSDAFFNTEGVEYYFISTGEMSEERKKLGYGEKNIPKYVKYLNKSEEEKAESQKLINQAEVVICGSAPRSLLDKRLKSGRLTFLYSERLYKSKIPYLKLPFQFIKNINRFIRFKNLYLLCASAYTAGDFSRTLSFINKTYKWGYFPEVKTHENIDSLIERKTPSSILWVARMIDWKHPEYAIEIANRLKQDGYNFKLNIIGNGVLEEKVRKSVDENGLNDCVEMLGAMSPEKVRDYMEKSEIFLFTSDRNEGWGAVLNESMNSACAVVASHAIGSVPFLIDDGKNGLIYKDGDLDDLYKKVKFLLDNEDERKRISKNAYVKLSEEWNAENAAKKFIVLAEQMLSGKRKPRPFEHGVCSTSKKLKDNWYHK